MADVLDEETEAVPKPNFHQHFRQQVQLLQSEIASLDDSNLSLDDRKSQTDTILTRLTRLTAELADASGELPSYDQRSYNQALKDIQDRLAVSQASYAPRPKFSFKSKRLAAASSEVNSATTSRSATPTHLKEPDSGLVGLKPTPAFAAPSVLSPSIREPTVEHFGDRDLDAPIKGIENSLDLASIGLHKYVCPTQTSSGQQSQQVQVISNLESSIVNLEALSEVSPLPSLTLSNIESSFILAPDVRGPTHMTGLRGSTLILSCQQFRMHNSHNVDVYLFCSSRPIIEDCSNIRFTRLPESFAGDVQRNKNMFDQVDDFKWLRSEASPNWKLMKENEGISGDLWLKIKQALHTLGTRLQGQDETETVQSIVTMVQSGNRKPE